jgi:hypothetical protein
MCAHSSEDYTRRHQSELLCARLDRVANAVIMVEDRRAELLMQDASRAPTDRLVAITREAEQCRAIASAATELVVSLRNVRPLQADSARLPTSGL